MNTAFRFAKYCACRLYYNRGVRSFLAFLVLTAVGFGFFLGCFVIISANPVAFFSVGAVAIVGSLLALAWFDFKDTEKGGA